VAWLTVPALVSLLCRAFLSYVLLMSLVYPCHLSGVQNENAEISQQVENLQKKLDSAEADANRASQDTKQLQQENDNAVAKLRGAMT